jgi:hypothetical protein
MMDLASLAYDLLERVACLISFRPCVVSLRFSPHQFAGKSFTDRDTWNDRNSFWPLRFLHASVDAFLNLRAKNVNLNWSINRDSHTLASDLRDSHLDVSADNKSFTYRATKKQHWNPFPFRARKTCEQSRRDCWKRRTLGDCSQEYNSEPAGLHWLAGAKPLRIFSQCSRL